MRLYAAFVECRTLVVEGGRNAPGARFVPIEEVVGELGTEHPEGAVVLRIGGRAVLDERHWDPIDLLWYELIEACGRLREGRSYSFLFPDQPLEFAVEFDARTGGVAVRVGGERAVETGRGEFLAVMVRAGLVAMEGPQRIVPRNGERFGRCVQVLRGMEGGHWA